MHRSRLFCTLASCLLAACLAACGGGSGSSNSPDESLLSGDYQFWALLGRQSMPDEGTTVWGTSTADGMGGLASTATDNVGGSVTTPFMFGGAYTVSDVRATTLVPDSGETFSGWTNAAGSLSTMGSVGSMNAPSILALLKLGSGFTDASLSGDYFACYYVVLGGGETVSYWGTLTFDGTGGVTGSLSYNLNGSSIGGPTAVMPSTYSVAGNGQTTFTFGTGENFEGATLAGGDLLLLVGDTRDMFPPFAGILVRKTSGASAATLNGTYQIVGLEKGDMGGFASVTGSIEADGMGGLVANFTRNDNGTISPVPRGRVLHGWRRRKPHREPDGRSALGRILGGRQLRRGRRPHQRHDQPRDLLPDATVRGLRNGSGLSRRHRKESHPPSRSRGRDGASGRGLEAAGRAGPWASTSASSVAPRQSAPPASTSASTGSRPWSMPASASPAARRSPTSTRAKNG